METKDWILLFVPIVANGIILYLIQLYFQSKIKKNEHKTEIKQKINSELFHLLLDSKNNFRALSYSSIDHPQDDKLFSDNLQKFNLSIRKILDYYHDYTFYLEKYSSNMKELEIIFDEYVNYGRSHQLLNDTIRKQLGDYFNKLFNLLCKLLNLYIKEI